MSVKPPIPLNNITGTAGSCLTAVLILVTIAGPPSNTIRNEGTLPWPMKKF